MSYNVFSCQAIGFVVVHKDDKFCCVDEKKGWYLPAGRIDFGENFLTGALRETLEEAGMNIQFDGILWIRYSFTAGYATVRCYLRGTPEEGEKIKNFWDKESHGAEWLTLKEVMGLRDKDESVLNKLSNIPRVKQLILEKKKEGVGELRSPFLVDMLEVGKKSHAFPLGLYKGIEGDELDPSIRTVESKGKSLVLLRRQDKFVLLSCELSSTITDVIKAAKHAIEDFLTKKGMMGRVTRLGEAELAAVLGLHHVAPKSKAREERLATYTFCFLAEVRSFKAKSKVEGYSLEYLKSKASSEEMFLLTNYENGLRAPLAFFTNTRSDFTTLEAV